MHCAEMGSENFFVDDAPLFLGRPRASPTKRRPKFSDPVFSLTRIPRRELSGIAWADFGACNFFELSKTVTGTKHRLLVVPIAFYG